MRLILVSMFLCFFCTTLHAELISESTSDPRLQARLKEDEELRRQKTPTQPVSNDASLGAIKDAPVVAMTQAPSVPTTESGDANAIASEEETSSKPQVLKRVTNTWKQTTVTKCTTEEWQ